MSDQSRTITPLAHGEDCPKRYCDYEDCETCSECEGQVCGCGLGKVHGAYVAARAAMGVKS